MSSDHNMLKLKSVAIRNFRAIETAIIPLHGELTVIIGDNATGKTAILEAIATCFQVMTRHFSRAERPASIVSINDFRVDSHGDLLGDPFHALSLEIEIDTTMGRFSNEFHLDHKYVDRPRVKHSYDHDARNWLVQLMESEETAPVLAYYQDDRGHVPRDGRPRYVSRAAPDRRSAYVGAFGGRVVFEEAVAWFEDMESAELREQRERRGTFTDVRLDAVRRAVESLVPQVSNPRMVGRPPQLSFTFANEGQPPVLLSAPQLSSGFRVMIALAMDLARRMADLNPHLPDPLMSPGVVLIDEIDLHLHPKWQQLVVDGLCKAFPNIQLIATTHSPQVLTTLRPENVLRLSWRNGSLKLDPVPSTEGAESGRLLETLMGVDQRPPANVSDFVAALEVYLELLRNGEAESEVAAKTWRKMLELSPDDPVLVTLELEKRRLAARQK